MNTPTDKQDSQRDPWLAALLQHCLDLQWHSLPPSTVDKAGHFVLDSLGVALCGTRSPVAQALLAWSQQRGGVAEAPVWGFGRQQTQQAQLPAAQAAAVNACLIHCLEYDCVHEGAVVHPLAVILSALLAEAQRSHPSGQDFICALVAAVEVASRLGMAARRPMRFFRPAMCGALGASVGLARLKGLQEDAAVAVVGTCYSQLSGTMQAHREGSPLLPVQIAFNARAAVDALDLTEAGLGDLGALRQPLSGELGYFNLFEEGGAPEEAWRGLGEHWQIEEVSYKPFPSGRATHGGLDGLVQLRQQHGFGAEDVDGMRLYAPPLILSLIGRRAEYGMTAAYARLCGAWTLACCARDGTLSARHFDAGILADRALYDLADRIEVLPGDEQDPNAMVPQRLEVGLKSGELLRIDLPQVLGSPDRTLDRPERLAKFHGCLRDAAVVPSEAQAEALIEAVENLPALPDAAELNRLMVERA